jgi:type IV fimbrial biogenesis protein FimT
MPSNHRHAGFTLQELMLSMAIFFILAALGVPGYLSYVRNSELSNATTDLFSDMYFARSEAIKRKSAVTICRSADATANNPVCGGTASNWSTGWLVFVDTGADGVFNSGADKLLKVGYPPTGIIQIKSNNKAKDRIEYSSDGSLNTLYAPAVFAVCDDRDSDGTFDTKYGRDLRIQAIGRPEITSGSIASCDNPS